MSLDERLKSGLRTMASPVEDSESALNAFRERAYPRRARRRIVEVAAGTLAAAALIVGVTSLALNSNNKASKFIHLPHVPLCRAGDVQLVTEAGDHGQFGLSLYSMKGACRIDETVAAIVTSNNLPFVTTTPVHRLAIQGNGSPVKFQGIVPSQSGHAFLSISWTWTNWCGPDRSYSLSFKRTAGTTDVLNQTKGNSGTISSLPSCIDASKSSVMTAGPATLTPQVTASGSSGPAYDKNPHIIAARPGLTNLILSPIDQVLVRPDGKTLIVSFTHGVGCRLFTRIDVKQDASGVTIGVYVGDVPGSQSACTGEVAYGDAALVTLEQPLGNRPIYDATHPENLGVPVYHVKS